MEFLAKRLAHSVLARTSSFFGGIHAKSHRRVWSRLTPGPTGTSFCLFARPDCTLLLYSKGLYILIIMRMSVGTFIFNFFMIAIRYSFLDCSSDNFWSCRPTKQSPHKLLLGFWGSIAFCKVCMLPQKDMQLWSACSLKSQLQHPMCWVDNTPLHGWMFNRTKQLQRVCQVFRCTCFTFRLRNTGFSTWYCQKESAVVQSTHTFKITW